MTLKGAEVVYFVNQINVAIEIFGSLISLTIIICLATSTDRKSKLNGLFLRIAICNMTALICDAVAWSFDGDVSAHAYVIVRVTKFFSYVLSYAMIPLLTDYIVALIGRNIKISRNIAHVMYALFGFAVLLVFISQFNHMYYDFDANNMYRIQNMFWLSQALGVLYLIIDTVAIMRYRKSMSISETFFLLSYAVFPLLAMIIQIFIWQELEFLFVASMVSITASYAGIQAQQGKLLKEKENNRALLLLNTAPLSCQLWDENFNIIDCNDECIRFFRLKEKEELFAHSGLNFVPEKQPCGGYSHELAIAYNKRAFAGERLTFDWTQLIEGELIPVEVTLDTARIGEETFMTAYVRDVREQKRINELEQELLQNKIDIMLSQIQPHFLYNSLSAVSRLCEINHKDAKEAVDDFAQYLRGNLDSLNKRVLIPFVDELEHVKAYLALEQLRFGSKLRVEYDIEIDDFKLPPLTVQPIAENAVCHGAMKRSGGGTVTVRVQKSRDVICITVADDGIGFDPAAPKEDGRSHIGIENVRGRLHALCDGTLTIDSTPGKGTAVMITIPTKEVRNEHHSVGR